MKLSGQGYTYQVSKFIKGHERRGSYGFNPGIHLPRFCACGCGLKTTKTSGRGVYNSFIRGHENIGRTSWNKGKAFSKVSREKMSLARLGKEPANKAVIDLKKLHQLYVVEQKSASLASKELGISKESVKNRLQALRWSRTVKESCSSEGFREQMRGIRVKALSSNKAIASPNRLEKLVYSTLDKYGVTYQKQVPLFNKFVVDILFPQHRFVLEIFGKYWHQMPVVKQKDFSKKKYLEKCGYRVQEIWDYEIKEKGISNVLTNVLSTHNIT